MKIIPSRKNDVSLAQQLLPLAIIAGVFAISMIFVLLIYRPSISLALLLAGGGLAVAFIILALKNMVAALTIVLLSSATIGVTIDTGRSTPLPIGLVLIMVLTLVWLLKMLIIDRRIQIKASPINLPILLFIISIVVSWVWSSAFRAYGIPKAGNLLTVQIGQFAIFLFSFAALYLTAHQEISKRVLNIWVVSIIGIGFSEMFLELFLGIYQGREMGITGVMFVLPVILLCSQLMFNPEMKIAPKVAGVCLLAVWGIWILNNLVWKGGWLPAVIGITILAWYKSRKLFVGFVIIALIGFVVNAQGVSQTLLTPEEQSVSTIRPYIWWDIFRMLLLNRSLIFGLGLVNYMSYWADAKLVSLARLKAGSEFINNFIFAMPSHNMFVDIFAQVGIVGLSFFLWSMGAILWVIHRASTEFNPGFMKAYVLGVFASFGAVLIGSFLFADWLIPFVYNITITGFRQSVYVWILVGSTVAFYYQIREKKREFGA